MAKGIGMLLLSNVALFIVALGALYFELTIYGIILFVLGIVTMPQLHAMFDSHDQADVHLHKGTLKPEDVEKLMHLFGEEDEDED